MKQYIAGTDLDQSPQSIPTENGITGIREERSASSAVRAVSVQNTVRNVFLEVGDCDEVKAVVKDLNLVLQN